MPSPKWERPLAAALRRARHHPGVVGVDYGFVYKDGVRLKTLGIRFHVGLKMPLNELPPEHVLPEKMEGYRCDVVEARYSLHASPRAVCDPLQLGVSVGNLQRGTTGTMGLWARDLLTGATGIISNWHVLCGSPEAKAGEPISQPGPMHLGTQPGRVAAVLERWSNLDTGCDAALALLSPGITANQSLFESPLTVSGVEKPRVGMKVVKYGAISFLTHGMVDGIGGAFQIDYSSYGDTTRWIDGLRIVVDPEIPEDEISLGGDSGAAWVSTTTGKAVALHFAGEDGLGPTAEYALAQPLDRVLKLLDADLAQ
jgi:hypothetical protein